MAKAKSDGLDRSRSPLQSSPKSVSHKIEKLSSKKEVVFPGGEKGKRKHTAANRVTSPSALAAEGSSAKPLLLKSTSAKSDKSKVKTSAKKSEKEKSVTPSSSKPSEITDTSGPIKKKRGRPRLKPLLDEQASIKAIDSYTFRKSELN